MAFMALLEGRLFTDVSGRAQSGRARKVARRKGEAATRRRPAVRE